MIRWREGYVSGGSTRFFVRVLGQSDPDGGDERGDDLIVCLHGFPETSAAWHRVAPILQEAGWRVACPDLKGFGRSDAPKRGYDPSTLADEIAQLIRSLHARKAVLIGHDWGGAVALATAFRHPGRVRALVLSNSPYREIDLRRAWHVPLMNVPFLPELAFRAQADRLVRASLRYLSARPEAFPEEVVREYVEATRDRPQGWLAYYRTLSRNAVMDLVTSRFRRLSPFASPSSRPRLRVPVTVVWGTEDPVLPLAIGARAAAELDADFVPLEGVGHFPHEEDPRAFATVVLELVGRNDLEDAS